jgi:hypothetical protein
LVKRSISRYWVQVDPFEDSGLLRSRFGHPLDLFTFDLRWSIPAILPDDRSDINQDTEVNATDLSMLLEDWKSVTGP